MGFNSFRVNVVLRVLLLLGNLFVLAWGYLHTDWQITLVFCSTLLLLQLVDIVHYVEMSNRQFASFLSAISERDFSTRYNLKGKGETFTALGIAFNQITTAFGELNSERAAKHQLLEALIEHISTALLCIDESGKIILMNQSAKKLFDFPYIHHAFALRKVDAQLPDLLASAQPGTNQLIKLKLSGELLPLSMFTTKFDLLGNSYSLISFQNIRDELESRELDSWQKLIKVLTHEIMNSVTPIVSLSSVIKQALVDDSGQIKSTSLTPVENQDLVRSLLAIEACGKGLVRFVQSYNNLANPPKPYFTEVALAPLLERISLLMLPELEANGISLQTRCVPDTLTLQADAQQLEQILINLIKNAREAIPIQERSRIYITALINQNRAIQISVRDTGSGIEQDKLQDIFIPFYTSKKTGSGIGLSISRQLVLANKGQISVTSNPGVGSEFILSFRQN